MPPYDYLGTIQTQLIPELQRRMPMGVQVDLEVMGQSFNVVFHKDGRWLQEFAVFLNDWNQIDYCPVFRQG